MLCENCGKNEANVKYTENINGVKKEMNLCKKCSEKLGINNIDLNMPIIDFSSFFGEFMEDLGTTLEAEQYMPFLGEVKELKCDNCGYTFNDIVNTGKLGCGNCYSIFEEKINPILKKIQGSSHHVGRIGKILDNVKYNKSDKIKKDIKPKESNKLEQLKEKLKQAVKEERYEDAAKIRDEIKGLEK